jgi:hypothetical protein
MKEGNVKEPGAKDYDDDYCEFDEAVLACG